MDASHSGPADLHQPTELIRFSVEQAGFAIFWIDPEGHFLYVNRKACESLGYSRDELLGMSVHDLDPNYPIGRRKQHWEEFKTQGVMTFETLHTRKDGTSFPVLVTNQYLRFQDQEIEFAFAVDITQQHKVEKALRGSEMELRQAQHVAKIGSWRFDLTEGTVTASDESKRIYGLGEKEFTIRAVQEIPLPEYRQVMDKALHDLVYEGKPYDIEFKIKRPSDGEILDIHSMAQYHKDSNAVIGTIQDITDRKRAEQAVMDSEEKHAALSRATMEAVFIIDNGICIETNQAACELFGYEYEEVIGRFGTDIIADKSKELVRRNMLSGDKKRYEALALRKDGSEFWVEIKGKSYEYRGKMVRATAIRDISDRKQAEQALRASEEKYRRVLDNSLEGIFIHQDDKVRYCNLRFAQMLGYDTVDPVIGMDLYDIVSPRDKQRVSREIASRDLGKKETSHYSFRILRQDGSELEIESLVTTIEYEGRRAYQGVFRDQSEQRKLEEQLRQAIKMESIGRLAGGIAHDFNNLLTAISGNAELVMLTLSDNDPIASDIQEIIDTTSRAGDLTRQLLTFSRKQITKPRTLNLNSVLGNFERLLRRTIGEDISLTLDRAPGLWNIHIDPSQTEQVLMNLVVNARDAMPDGGELHIVTENCTLEGDISPIEGAALSGRFVSITVADTGIGMDVATLERIFEPFYTTKESGRGTGLGLSTVYGIIKQNEGHVVVDSDPGRGTTFRIYFPMIEAEVTESVEQRLEIEKLRGHETILVVEDDVRVRDTAVRALHRFGYNVHTAVSGADALLMLDRKTVEPHLILTDIIMPNMNGDEFAQRAEQQGYAGPILFMSGYTESDRRSYTISLGGRPFLQKPFKPLELVSLVRDILDE